jgi:hypothetical protein
MLGGLGNGVRAEAPGWVWRQNEGQARAIRGNFGGNYEALGVKTQAATIACNVGSIPASPTKWIAKHAPRWAPGHADKIIRRLERGVFPWLGDWPVGKLTAPELLVCLRRIEARGAIDTAHRALQSCGQVFRYAMATAAPSVTPRPICAGRWRP